MPSPPPSGRCTHSGREFGRFMPRIMYRLAFPFAAPCHCICVDMSSQAGHRLVMHGRNGRTRSRRDGIRQYMSSQRWESCNHATMQLCGRAVCTSCSRVVAGSCPHSACLMRNCRRNVPARASFQDRPRMMCKPGAGMIGGRHAATRALGKGASHGADSVGVPPKQGPAARLGGREWMAGQGRQELRDQQQGRAGRSGRSGRSRIAAC
jgi:hypothetical protein